MRKPAKMIASLLVAMSLAVSGCAGNTTNPASSAGSTGAAAQSSSKAEAAPAADKKLLRIAQSSECGNLNPTIYPKTPDTNVTCLVYDPLVGPNADLSFEGILADSWTVSEDGLTYTFKLKSGIQWHDGEPFTAQDVAFTFEAMAHPNYNGGFNSRVSSIVGAEERRAGSAESVEGIKVVDDSTISFTLVKPDASFLSQLYIGVLPEHILKDVNPGEWDKHDSNRAPIGTGPYKFTKWESGQYIQLNKNDGYFRGAPKIDEIIYKFGDIQTMTTALMQGEVDIVDGVSPSEVELIESNTDTSIHTYPMLSMYYIGLNLQNEHFKDLRVRQAMSYALNKEKIVTNVYGEFGEVCDDLFPNSHWAHNPNATKYPYDPAKSKTLLEEAGYKLGSDGIYAKDGKALKFTYDLTSGSNESTEMAQLIQQAFSDIGIAIELRVQEFNTLAFTRLLPKDSAGQGRAVEAGDFDMYTLGFGIEADPDEYRPYFATEFIPPNGYNFCSYSNPKADELFEQELRATDQAKRQEIFHQISQILADDVPWIPVYGRTIINGVSNKVQNFAPDFRGITYNAHEWDLQ